MVLLHWVATYSRRMEEAVDDLQTATHLCKQIVLGPRKELVKVGK